MGTRPLLSFKEIQPFRDAREKIENSASFHGRSRERAGWERPISLESTIATRTKEVTHIKCHSFNEYREIRHDLEEQGFRSTGNHHNCKTKLDRLDYKYYQEEYPPIKKSQFDTQLEESIWDFQRKGFELIRIDPGYNLDGEQRDYMSALFIRKVKRFL